MRRAVEGVERAKGYLDDVEFSPEDAARTELEFLAEANADQTETTLLIHPNALTDFLDFNDFLDVADGMVDELELDGIIQVASFHPQFQFEGTFADDISNYTNRSPYPTLHLLREDSVERAVDAFPDELAIVQTNIATLEKLGHEGWVALGLTADAPLQSSPASAPSR